MIILRLKSEDITVGEEFDYKEKKHPLMNNSEDY